MLTAIGFSFVVMKFFDEPARAWLNGNGALASTLKRPRRRLNVSARRLCQKVPKELIKRFLFPGETVKV